jgi:hypothetical protein
MCCFFSNSVRSISDSENFSDSKQCRQRSNSVQCWPLWRTSVSSNDSSNSSLVSELVGAVDSNKVTYLVAAFQVSDNRTELVAQL